MREPTQGDAMFRTTTLADEDVSAHASDQWKQWALRVSNPRPSPCKGEEEVLVSGLTCGFGCRLSACEYVGVHLRCYASVMQRVVWVGDELEPVGLEGRGLVEPRAVAQAARSRATRRPWLPSDSHAIPATKSSVPQERQVNMGASRRGLPGRLTVVRCRIQFHLRTNPDLTRFAKTELRWIVPAQRRRGGASQRRAVPPRAR